MHVAYKLCACVAGLRRGGLQAAVSISDLDKHETDRIRAVRCVITAVLIKMFDTRLQGY
jgi:hypothetical protein